MEQKSISVWYLRFVFWTFYYFWLPTRWSFGFSGDHQQNIQCVLIYICCVLISMWCSFLSVKNKGSTTTCQNHHFGKSVRLSVFMSDCSLLAKIENLRLTVCVFVRQSVVVAIAHERLDQSTPNLTQICIPVAVKVCVLFSVDDVINDVIRSKNRLKFWTSVTPSIFKLERWSKAQIIANARDYLAGIFDFRYHIRWKSSK